MSAIVQTFDQTGVLDLDALRRMSYTELGELYRTAKRPNHFRSRRSRTRRDAGVETSTDWSNRMVAAQLGCLDGISLGPATTSALFCLLSSVATKKGTKSHKLVCERNTTGNDG